MVSPFPLASLKWFLLASTRCITGYAKTTPLSLCALVSLAILYVEKRFTNRAACRRRASLVFMPGSGVIGVGGVVLWDPEGMFQALTQQLLVIVSHVVTMSITPYIVSTSPAVLPKASPVLSPDTSSSFMHSSGGVASAAALEEWAKLRSRESIGLQGLLVASSISRSGEFATPPVWCINNSKTSLARSHSPHFPDNAQLIHQFLYDYTLRRRQRRRHSTQHVRVLDHGSRSELVIHLSIIGIVNTEQSP
ncbi:hypothetical protein NP233_g11897 [Leucocoprinus birnbaumii]|uniref:Transmembrane protein n=1 Tax=Leucocoprinus birnbaumii TaxID=56174 RepID=A0AAD5VG44_9AGAR|nr:hypothetical protein NP233_g11897 [Leucocoprinus birnbaumii]